MKSMKFCRKILLAACAAVLLPFVARAAETQLVTATGYGMSVDEAKKAAVRAAVESVVGTLVDAETIVENDQLVQDKILSYSMGMVEDVKLIGVPQKNSAGLVKVRAQVKVRKSELAERVKSTIKTSVKIDGESLYQTVTFNLKNNSDAKEIMQSLFSPERMQCLFKFEPDMDQGNPLDVDLVTGEVCVAIKGGLDLSAYQQWTDEIIEKLEPMATKKVSSTHPNEYSTFCPNTLHKMNCQGQLSILLNTSSWNIVRLEFPKDKWAILEKIFSERKWTQFKHPGYRWPRWVISISLLDKEGAKIKSADIRPRPYTLIHESTIYPLFGGLHQFFPKDGSLDCGEDFCHFCRVNVSLGDLDVKDLRKIDSIAVEVVWSYDQ